MLTRLGESGVDAFTIMRIAGHSSIIVSQRYILQRLRQWSVLSSGCNCMVRGGDRGETTATRYSIRYTDAGGLSH